MKNIVRIVYDRQFKETEREVIAKLDIYPFGATIQMRRLARMETKLARMNGNDCTIKYEVIEDQINSIESLNRIIDKRIKETSKALIGRINVANQATKMANKWIVGEENRFPFIEIVLDNDGIIMV